MENIYSARVVVLSRDNGDLYRIAGINSLVEGGIHPLLIKSWINKRYTPGGIPTTMRGDATTVNSVIDGIVSEKRSSGYKVIEDVIIEDSDLALLSHDWIVAPQNNTVKKLTDYTALNWFGDRERYAASRSDNPIRRTFINRINSARGHTTDQEYLPPVVAVVIEKPLNWGIWA